MTEARLDRIAARWTGTTRSRRMLLAVGGMIGLLSAAVLACGVAELAGQQREAARGVEHTLHVLEQAATFDADIATVASEGRGFLVDRSADSAERFEAASRRIERDLDDLRALTADNPAQQAVLDRLAPLVAARVEFLRAIIGRLHVGDQVGAAGLVRTHRGRAMADQIHDATQGLRAEERRLLGARSGAQRRAEWLVMAGLGSCGVLLAASGLSAAALLIGRKRERARLAELHESEATLRSLNGEVERRAEEFQALADNIPTLCWMACPDGHIHWYNRRWHDYIGGDPKRQEGWGWQAAHDPEILPAVIDRWRRSLATGEPFDMTFPLKGADGTFRPFLTRVVPIRDAEGRITRWFGTNTDITEQREAERAVARHRDELEHLVAERTAELSASEARYRMLADNTSDAITTLSLDLRRTYVSPAYRALFGYEPDAMVGGAPAAIIHPDDADAVYARLRPLAAGSANHVQATYRLRHREGRWVWVEANFSLARDRARQPALIICAVRDVSERKRAEAAMTEANRWLTLGEQVAGLCHWRYEPSSGHLHWSAEIYRIYGLDPDGPPPTVEQAIAAYHPEDRALIRHAVDHAIAERDGYDLVVRLVRRDGQIRHVHARAVVETGPSGEVEALFGVFIDVTDQVRADAAVRESEARYRMLADNTRDAITMLDLHLRRTYASPACRSIFGYEPEEMLGHQPAATMHPDDWDEVHARLRRVASGKAEQERVVNRIRHKHGHLVWIEAGFSLVRDAEGRPASIICTMRDVSERQAQADALRLANTELERLARHLTRARDAAEQASRAKSRFLASMSHELRTPLNGIMGYAELLRLEGGLNTAQAARVGAMLGAGQHLLEMINGVLDLSEIEQGHIELRPVKIELRSAVHACLDLVRPAADAKGLALTMDVAPGTPSSIVADPTRLRQVLLNLLGNAVKFTARGAVGLRLAVAGDRLRIDVADTGPGIPAERHHRLFQDFERLGAEAGAEEGAGLGLALSARLAALLGGQLGHEANPGGGSVFRLELPLAVPGAGVALVTADVPDKLGLPGAASAATPTAGASRLRVLVVDDVAMNRDIAGSFLRAAGHEVVCAEGGGEAVEIATNSDFDVVLMDVRMPEVDGLEATRRIRALASPRALVPIVALTAQAFAEQVSECRQAGMDSHLAKPFTPDALREAVARAAAAGPDDAGRLQRRTRQAMAAADGKPAGPASPTDAAPPAPAPGSELPVLDQAAFERTAAYLAPGSLATHLETIAGRGEALLRALRAPGALARSEPDLAAAAHTLAGSAGMFGFERLATTARRFEHAVQTGAADAQALADGLAAAISASLPELPGRLSRGTAGADSGHRPENGFYPDAASRGSSTEAAGLVNQFGPSSVM